MTEDAGQNGLHGIDQGRVAGADESDPDSIKDNSHKYTNQRKQDHHADLIRLRNEQRLAADEASDKVYSSRGQHDIAGNGETVFFFYAFCGKAE